MIRINGEEVFVDLGRVNELLKPMRSSWERLYRHSFRVANLSLRIAGWLHLEAETKKTLLRGALLHDVGKMCINREIINKPSKLNEEEWLEIKKHTGLGALMAAEHGEDSSVVQIIRCHHERWDGRGYEGRSGKQIPFGARIIALADAFDAMISVRPYRRSLQPEEALEQICQGAGSQFDPLLVASLKDKPFWQIATYCDPTRITGQIDEEQEWLSYLIKACGKQLHPLAYAQKQWLDRLTSIAGHRKS